MPLAVLSFRKTKYFYKGKLDWDERSSAGRYVRENCKALRVQLASLLVFLLTCYLCHNSFPYSYFFEFVVIGLRSGCLHSAVHRSISRVFASFYKQNQGKKGTRFWILEYSHGIFAFWFVRSFVLFRFKKSIARNHRTFDFNLVPKILSYPSPTEREGKTEGLGDRTWERGWFDFSSHLPYLFEYAPNLELAPTSSKRPSKRQKKVYLPLKKTLNTYFK